jgi:hypothetical protein
MVYFYLHVLHFLKNISEIAAKIMKIAPIRIPVFEKFTKLKYKIVVPPKILKIKGTGLLCFLNFNENPMIAIIIKIIKKYFDTIAMFVAIDPAPIPIKRGKIIHGMHTTEKKAAKIEKIFPKFSLNLFITIPFF